MATPMLQQIQRETKSFLALRRCISWSKVTRNRRPEAPIGWPSAMAPPFTFTSASSRPNSLCTVSGEIYTDTLSAISI